MLASRARFRIAFCYTTSGGKYQGFFIPAHEKDRHPHTAKQSSVVTYCRPAVTLCSFCTYQTVSRRFVKIHIQRNSKPSVGNLSLQYNFRFPNAAKTPV